MNWKKIERIHIVLLIGVVLLVSLVLFSQFRNDEMLERTSATSIFDEEEEELSFTEIKEENSMIVIDIKGAIEKPGVYELKEGSRIYEAIDQAGGLLEGADENSLNFAELLYDEMMVYVPFLEDDVQVNEGVGNNGKIPLNRADQALLEQLPGIGPAKAQAIIAYREENGPFKDVDELLDVSGIGPKSLERLRDYIVLH